MTEDEIENIFKQAERQRRLREADSDRSESKGIQTKNKEIKEGKWDLSGSIYDCMKRYADYLDQDQIDEVIEGLEAGLSEKQIKSYWGLPAEKMSQYRRAYMFGNGK